MLFADTILQILKYFMNTWLIGPWQCVNCFFFNWCRYFRLDFFSFVNLYYNCHLRFVNIVNWLLSLCVLVSKLLSNFFFAYSYRSLFEISLFHGCKKSPFTGLISVAFSSRVYVRFGHVGFLHCSHMLRSTPRFSLPAGPWHGKGAEEDMKICNSSGKSVGGIKLYSLFSPSVLFLDIKGLYCSITQH